MNDTKSLILGIAITIAVLLFSFACLQVGSNVTRDDRQSRIEKYRVCATIEDQSLRALCVNK